MITSCGDFLEEKSQDLFIPKTVQDYKEFVAGEMLNMGQHNGVVLAEYLDILTDDVSDRVKPRRKDSQDSREKMWGYYSWQAEPEIDFNNTFTADQLWNVAYHRILTANIILNRLPEITGEQAKKNDLEAEVRFIRAWSYFMLVNVYAKPYEDATQASTTIAVPLNTATSVENRQLKRATLADIYTLIEEDLTKAVTLFSETNITKNIYRPNLNASLLLLSRVALYTKQYQKAVDWATQLINNGSVKLFDLSKQPVRSTLRFFDEENKEILLPLVPETHTAYMFTFQPVAARKDAMLLIPHCMQCSTLTTEGRMLSLHLYREEASNLLSFIKIVPRTCFQEHCTFLKHI